MINQGATLAPVAADERAGDQDEEVRAVYTIAAKQLRSGMALRRPP